MKFDVIIHKFRHATGYEFGNQVLYVGGTYFFILTGCPTDTYSGMLIDIKIDAGCGVEDPMPSEVVLEVWNPNDGVGGNYRALPVKEIKRVIDIEELGDLAQETYGPPDRCVVNDYWAQAGARALMQPEWEEKRLLDPGAS